MRVALIVDNPYRDLPGLVLLAAYLCQRDVTCFLVPMYFTHELCMLAPDLVLFNYLRVNNQEVVRQMQNAGVMVAVLDTEGGVLPDMSHYTKTMAADRNLYRKVTCFMSWGPKLAEYLKKEGWYDENQIVVTGAPRFDYYVPPLRTAALRASHYVECYPPPLVLINGNFPVANPRFQTPDMEVQMMVERFGYDRQHALAWQRTSKEAMHQLVTLCNSLARRFPEVSFVYRPHPFEKSETYETLLDKRENLFLDKTGTVDGWILRAKAVIQRSCSTAIEAGMAGVPALTPSWITTPFIMQTAEDVSSQCETEEDLMRQLDEVLAGSFTVTNGIQQRLSRVIADWFLKLDGKAHERVAAHILQFSGADQGHRRFEKCRSFAYDTKSPSLALKARAKVFQTLRLPVHWSFRRWGNVNLATDLGGWANSEKFFDATSVKRLLDSIQASDPDAERWKSVKVTASQERGDYYFGYLQGQAVTLYPTDQERRHDV